MRGTLLRSAIAGAVAAIALAPVPAAAQQAVDTALSRCLVARTSPADRALLMRWVFGAISVSDAVRDLTKVTEAQREQLAKESAALFSRLLLKDCRAEAVADIRVNGPSTISGAFGVLGQVAMADLMAAPPVIAEVAKLATYSDTAGLVGLMVEAQRK